MKKRPLPRFFSIFSIISLSLVVGFVSCDEERSSSSYAVNFRCNGSVSPFNQTYSYGSFITIRRKSSSSYEVTDASGRILPTIMLSESEAREGFYYGLGGLIIGTPSLGDGNIWAFDLSCPVCDRAKYRLTLARDGTGQALCPQCGNVYDLNSGGILLQGSGRSLWRYSVIQQGGYLYIHN